MWFIPVTKSLMLMTLTQAPLDISAVAFPAGCPGLACCPKGEPRPAFVLLKGPFPLPLPTLSQALQTRLTCFLGWETAVRLDGARGGPGPQQHPRSYARGNQELTSFH